MTFSNITIDVAAEILRNPSVQAEIERQLTLMDVPASELEESRLAAFAGVLEPYSGRLAVELYHDKQKSNLAALRFAMMGIVEGGNGYDGYIFIRGSGKVAFTDPKSEPGFSVRVTDVTGNNDPDVKPMLKLFDQFFEGKR